MRKFVLPLAFALMVSAPLAQQASVPQGLWVDSYGTAFQMQQCGAGTDLCAVLKDVQGQSRTPENLAYVDQTVMQAQQVASNQWTGTLVFNGSEARGTVTQIDQDTIKIQGCRGIFCSTLTFERV